MKSISIKVVAVLGALALSLGAQAGNPDRVGQAGATELLINSFARSSGWGAVHSAGITGLEATQLNIAGIAYTPRTEVVFARTNWLVPSGVHVSTFGFAQKLKNEAALSLSINNLSFGEIQRTTTDHPEGGIGTFSPQFLNVGIGYAKRFSNSISGGIQMKIINEAIEDVRASGVALDAGVQYKTSSQKKGIKKDDIKFGISIRNVGPDMKFSGDGLSIKARINGNNSYDNTVENRVATFNLPSQVNIGASYDIRLDKDSNTYFHRLTAAGNFVSNSFSRNNLVLGLEYAYKEFLMLRTGFVYEKDIFKQLAVDGRQTALTGFCGGLTFELPLNKKTGTTLGFDYSYRSTNPFRGIHSFGIRLNLQ
ncbi:MAG: PorV/PorQ family protein [Bacteroidetes bacterium]|nr:PorV/PorQ family protein [Bacteroidota bacterium]